METYTGIYFIPEMARYLWVTSPREGRPSYHSLLRWIASGLPSREAARWLGRKRWITFEDLISLRMIMALRQAGFSLQHIREVHQWLQEQMKYPRPFALHDIWVSETDIFLQIENRLVSASRKGQYALEIVREWLRRLPKLETVDMAFERQVNGQRAVSRWRPYPFVVLDPRVQFGSPCIEGTRIPTSAVWAMFRAHDSEATIAEAYQLPLEKVKLALEWEEHLAKVK